MIQPTAAAGARSGLTQALGAVTNHRKNKVGQIHSIGMPADQFVEFSSPIAWHHSSQHLHRAANVVAAQVAKDWQHLEACARAKNPPDSPENPYRDLFNQFFLLAAFALENILKGIVVGVEPELTQQGKLQGILTSHDLLALSSRAKVSLSPEESRLCELASSASVSWGRYPVSIKAQQHVNSASLSGSSIEIFNGLYSRLAAGFFEHIKAAKSCA
jgi:hypothetical protein